MQSQAEFQENNYDTVRIGDEDDRERRPSEDRTIGAWMKGNISDEDPFKNAPKASNNQNRKSRQGHLTPLPNEKWRSQDVPELQENELLMEQMLNESRGLFKVTDHREDSGDSPLTGNCRGQEEPWVSMTFANHSKPQR